MGGNRHSCDDPSTTKPPQRLMTSLSDDDSPREAVVAAIVDRMLTRREEVMSPQITATTTLVPSQRFVVLLMSGSFSPIHLSHFAIMEAAAGAVATLRPFCCVVAGVFVPSTDDYVMWKLGPSEAIPRTIRCQLIVDSLLQMTTDDADQKHRNGIIVRNNVVWAMLDYNTASGPHAARRLDDELRAALCSQTTAPISFSVLQVFGSDYMVRSPGVMRCPMVIVARDDDEGSAAQCRRMLEEAAAKRRHASDPSTAADFIHNEFMFVESEVPAVSSTRIRAACAALSRCRSPTSRPDGSEEDASLLLRRQLLQWTTPPVVDYLTMTAKKMQLPEPSSKDVC